MLCRKHLICLAGLVVFVACPRGSWGAEEPAAGLRASGNDQAHATAAAARQLALQVRELAQTTGLSRSKKEKRISTAVRVAVVAATAYQEEPEKILGVALAMTEAAVAEAPGFSESIARAVALAPAVAKVDGSQGRIMSLAGSVARNPMATRPSNYVQLEREDSPAVVRSTRELDGLKKTMESSPGDTVTSSEVNTAGTGVDASTVTLQKRTRFVIKASVGVKYDSNVFLLNRNAVGDTIGSVAPGFDFTYGDPSAVHGSLGYQESFLHYFGGTAPNVTLGAGQGDFGFDDGRVAIAANASYQQLDQNDIQNAATGAKGLFRRDIVFANTGLQVRMGAKSSLGVGAEYDQTYYRTGGFDGSQGYSFPVQYFWNTTAKFALESGVTYRLERPQNAGPSARDLFYNIGAKGEFTPKLTGDLYLGYRTRNVTGVPSDSAFGFDANLDYALTEKSTCALVLSRDFNIGARGQNLLATTYQLRFDTTPMPDWHFGANVMHVDDNFGAPIFEPLAGALKRTDHYWEGGLLAGYALSHWLSATFDYTVRNNHSTLLGADYTANTVGLNWEVKY